VREQFLNQMLSDESGAAGDKGFHAVSRVSKNSRSFSRCVPGT
jgi:hypothetical protein